MDVFALRNHLVDDYRHYVESFLTVRDERVRDAIAQELDAGLLWPEPRVQINPRFAPGGSIADLAQDAILANECKRIFRIGKSEADPVGEELRLHRHQREA